MTNLLNDLRFGIRTMAKDRAFTLVAIVTLAVALGANTAIFSVVNGILLRPLPFADSGRLMKVEGRYHDAATLDTVFSYPNLADLRAQTHAFEGFGIYLGSGSFVREGDVVEPVMGTYMTAEGMRLLGVKPQLGSSPTPTTAAARRRRSSSATRSGGAFTTAIRTSSDASRTSERAAKCGRSSG
jgi:hypothetical protein